PRHGRGDALLLARSPGRSARSPARAPARRNAGADRRDAPRWLARRAVLRAHAAHPGQAPQRRRDPRAPDARRIRGGLDRADAGEELDLRDGSKAVERDVIERWPSSSGNVNATPPSGVGARAPMMSAP